MNLLLLSEPKEIFSRGVEYAVRNNVDLSSGDATRERNEIADEPPRGTHAMRKGSLTTNIDFLTFINATDR